MIYQPGTKVHFDTGHGVVEARVFRALAGKIWIDHHSFSRARVIAADSNRILGEA